MAASTTEAKGAGANTAAVSEASNTSASTAEQLMRENQELKAELARLNKRVNEYTASKGDHGASMIPSIRSAAGGAPLEIPETANSALSVVVLGASGDLAWKKTFPALFALHCHGLLPSHAVIAGFARSEMDEKKFREKISANFPKEQAAKKEEFLSRCFYHAGAYDSPSDFKAFAAELDEREQKSLPAGRTLGSDGSVANRIFYFAIPPTLFVKVGKGIQPAAMSKTGWNRVIVEKPFGKDSDSSAELGRQLAALFDESQIYRIDHYLGKEMVQNLMVLRFANEVFEPIWSRHHINNIQITFKEDFGTGGRAGYFDESGIIRDVMQNHLMQILSLLAMEPPVSLSAEDVRTEKVKLLRAIRPITLEDLVVGQYKADPKGKEPGYLEDKGVPKDSVTPTFALAVLHINNPRWKHVPFILKCGKALTERKTEVRIQFHRPAMDLFEDISPNELVLRVQPDEAVYLKMTTKKPGLQGGLMHTELDLSYKNRHAEETKSMPDAYERLILDVIRGDHNLFVRSDELEAAWRIFTPILHQLVDEKIKPVPYDFGSRGPAEADELVKKYGYKRTTGYRWHEPAKRSPREVKGEGKDKET